MELANTRVVPAPVDRVWAALNDPDVLKACIPGCEAFERQPDGSYGATVATRIGPVSARFNGRLELLDVEPPTSYRIRFNGQGGAAGFASGEAKVRLSPDAGGTALAYAASAQVGGKIAQIGSRLIDGAAAKLADDFFARFAERVGAEEPEPAPAAPTAVRTPETASGAWVRWTAIAGIIAIIAYLLATGGTRF